MDAAAARMAGPAAEWPMRSDGAPWLARSVRRRVVQRLCRRPRPVHCRRGAGMTRGRRSARPSRLRRALPGSALAGCGSSARGRGTRRSRKLAASPRAAEGYLCADLGRSGWSSLRLRAARREAGRYWTWCAGLRGHRLPLRVQSRRGTSRRSASSSKVQPNRSRTATPSSPMRNTARSV